MEALRKEKLAWRNDTPTSRSDNAPHSQSLLLYGRCGESERIWRWIPVPPSG